LDEKHARTIENMGNTAVKNLFVAVAVAVIFVSQPALANTLADPVVDADVVAQAAMDDSMGDIDALMIALGYVLLLLVVGGAF